MTDVFLRLMPQSNLRAGLAWAVIERWKMEPDVNLRLIVGAPTVGSVEIHRHCKTEIVLPSLNFHWTSRRYAEEMSRTCPYVLGDDDRLILGEHWMRRALALWERAHAEGFVLLSDNSCIESERQWPSGVESWTARSCPEYFDAPHQAGANYLAKKGTVDYSQFTFPANRQDEEVAAFLRSKGHRFGFMRDVLSLHAGFGLSQAEPRLWLRY